MALSSRTRVLITAALLVGTSLASPSAQPTAVFDPPASPAGGKGGDPGGEALRPLIALDAGNEIYRIWVEDEFAADCGAWTAATGPLHPATGLSPIGRKNVLYNGQFANPGTSDTTLRSYNTGIYYRTGPNAGDDFDRDCRQICFAAELTVFEPIETPGPSGPVRTGWRTIWRIDDGGRLLEFVQEVNVEGPVDGSETVDDTVIRETHSVRNLSSGAFRFGIRKHWDWQIAMDDGPAFGDCDTPEEACDRSMNLTGDGSLDGFYPASYTINHDPRPMSCPPGIVPLESGCGGNPLYLVAGTVAPPSALDPPPDPPDLLQFNNWDIVVRSCWQERLIDAAPCGASGNPAGDDSTIAYFYGLDSASAIVAGSGEERSFTQYVVAAQDQCPGIIQEPTLSCDAGGPYQAECTGPVVSIPLDGSGSSDSGAPPLYEWSTDCPGGRFDDPTAESPVLTLLAGDCLSSCTVTLRVTDEQDPGASLECSAPVTVTDTVGPELSCPPEPLEVECEAGGVAREHPLVLDWLAQASAFDACSGEAVPVSDDLPASLRLRDCPTIVPVTFSSVDDCGNPSSCVQELRLVDTQPPLPSCPPDRRFECGDPVGDQQAWLSSGSASDSCSGSASLEPELESVESPCPSTTVETWRFTAADSCGNEASCLATWTVGDGTPPVVTPPPPVVVECGTPGAPPLEAWLENALATDSCSGDPPVMNELVSEEVPCPNTVVQTWRFFAIDDCGNEGEAFSTRTVQDTLPPELLGVPADETVSCDAVPPPAEPTARDLCDEAPVVSFLEERRDGACPHEYELLRSWTATDACGNASTASQVVTVVDDEPPVLSGVPADATVACDAVPEPASPAAADACGAVTIELDELRTDGACPGDYTLTRTWTATDECGNASSRSQVLTVVDDQPPQLSGVPPDESVDCSAVPAPAEPTAVDDCGPASVDFEELRVDGPCPQTHELHRTWTATDACGNAVSQTQILSVSDTTAPELSGVPADATVECDAVPPPASPSAVDDCGAALVSFEELRTDGACPQSYELRRTWTAEDECGNAASRTQVLTVVDTTAPVLSGVPADAVAECDAVPPPANPGAADACGAVTIVFAELRSDGACPQEYQLTRTWTAEDECGNAVSESQVVTVVDTTPPVLAGVPADATVECDAVPPPASPTATDNCGTPVLSFNETRTDGACPQAYELTRTWTAEDECGNSSSESQVLTVVDSTPPELTVPPPLELECLGPGGVPLGDPRVQAWLASASATDNCSLPAVSHDAPPLFPFGCPDPIAVPVTFTAVDDCGNAVSLSSTVTVVDTTPPVIESVDLPGCLWPPNHRYACFEDLASRVIATDTCSSELSVRFAGCASDQPDEAPDEGDRGGQELGNGDGRTFDDCVVAPDGSAACLRAERQGTDPGGRNYTLLIEVADACGNVAQLPWGVHVPHDQREHDCEKLDNKDLLKKQDPFPWE